MNLEVDELTDDQESNQRPRVIGTDNNPEFEIPAKISIALLTSRALSAWGDRLWAFGIGIFMNLLGPKNLRLVAIFGFSTNVSVIVFGAGIGGWIDITNRLAAAKISLLVQNLVSGIGLCMIWYHEWHWHLQIIWQREWHWQMIRLYEWHLQMMPIVVKVGVSDEAALLCALEIIESDLSSHTVGN